MSTMVAIAVHQLRNEQHAFPVKSKREQAAMGAFPGCHVLLGRLGFRRGGFGV